MRKFGFSKTGLAMLLAFITSILLSSTTYSQVPQQERDALIALYNSANGSGWENNSGWLGEAGTECSWYGITCFQNTTVVQLALINNGLSGTIPPELGDLPFLETLYLGRNNLSGPIPPELGNLSNLETLSISSTDITGEIPPTLGNLSNLFRLELSNNKLTGTIPPELGNLPRIDSLSLSGNNLTGPIPTEFENFAGSPQEFYALNLSNNQLSSSIPPELSNLEFLEFIDLSNNQLTGQVPQELLDRQENRELGFWFYGNFGLYTIEPPFTRVVGSNGGYTSARIRGGITADNKQTFRSSFKVGDNIEIIATLEPAIMDVGTHSELFVVAALDNNYLMITPNGLVPWDETVENLIPFEEIELTENYEFSLLQPFGGKFTLTTSEIGSYLFFVGYSGLDGVIIYTGVPIELRVLE